MRRTLIALSLAVAPVALLGACTAATEQAATGGYDMAASRATMADVEMAPDTSYLTDEERQVVNLLIEASGYMDEIYLRQRGEGLPEMRSQIEASGDADTLDMFDRHFGPWDSVADNHPFYGDTAWPEGAGFYPADLTREEFDAYLEANPDQRDALMSPYTVVRRDGDGFVAVPYSEEYAEFLQPAAEKLREAAAITTNPSLKRFLTLRADSFESDDYFESEMAWMDLTDTPIEVAIGPYEVYTDRLYGTKTAFESFVTLRNPDESAALDRYVGYLRDMEGNLPIDAQYHNFARGFESPIAVADQIHGGGDNVPGVQTIAFNLPNDERVREAKGAKKVILANVLGAKFDMILDPIADVVLAQDQAALVSRRYMQLFTLFHELSHSLGPGSITVDGRTTTVNEELREQYSALEESKADVMGIYNLLYMMERGELPVAEKSELLQTYFAGLFRTMRQGIESAHGKGAAAQYGFLLDYGAFSWDEDAGHFVVDEAKLESGITELLRTELMLQATGDYDGTIAFFERYARLDEHAEAAIAGMDGIPVDIRPIYPDGI
ncbi:dipeptidyl-peptidase 3 family protein [Aurantiacibacter marinus]|uniref:DNA mismatch repair protein MutT n=1 Tax=Aurantiacibacter marinus TaxID=874156 RepID=A0A0H0XNI7_9SPHN|nr:DNA mismatch repair protein MutT [Aurantiacibacter marinus]KLI63507.1 DNA mismatch repair protein MutT [Aurantiacibacter marinus]